MSCHRKESYDRLLQLCINVIDFLTSLFDKFMPFFSLLLSFGSLGQLFSSKDWSVLFFTVSKGQSNHQHLSVEFLYEVSKSTCIIMQIKSENIHVCGEQTFFDFSCQEVTQVPWESQIPGFIVISHLSQIKLNSASKHTALHCFITSQS